MRTVEQMKVDKNWNSKLLELFADSFPHFKFPEAEYEEKSEANGSISTSARIKLLGQNFSSGPYKSKEEALESVSSIAYEVIKEFNTLVLSETQSTLNCESLFSLLCPLQDEAKTVASTVSQEALRSVSEIKNRLIQDENDKMNQKVKTKSEKMAGKMQGTLQSDKPDPFKVTKIEEKESEDGTCSVQMSLSPLKIIDVPDKIQEKKESKLVIGAPIPAFYEFVEKQSSNDPIVFDDYNKGYLFGSRLRWGKRFWVSPAEFKQKKDARNYAALMACVECFGEGFTFEGVDPRIYQNWTRESVRQASDKYSFANSDELLIEEANKAKLDSAVNLSMLKVEPLEDGRKFTSVVNEICQKLRMTPPNYQVASVNSLTNYYVCSVKNFHDLPLVESNPFAKKNEAKEDAAGKIYYVLKQKGIVDEASRTIGRMKAFELATQNKLSAAYQFAAPLAPKSHSQTKNSETIFFKNESYSPDNNIVNTAASPPTPDHSTHFPFQTNSTSALSSFMPMMMMMMSQMTQQPGQSFDPVMMQSFMEMSRQWQAFLAWQQQQKSSQVPIPQHSSPEYNAQYAHPSAVFFHQNHHGPSLHEDRKDNRVNSPSTGYNQPSSSGQYHHYQPSVNNYRDRQEWRRDNRKEHRPGRDRSPTEDPGESAEGEKEHFFRKRSYQESRRKN